MTTTADLAFESKAVTVKALLAHIKGADSVYMHVEADPNRESYSDAAIFTVSAKRCARMRPCTPERIAKIEVPGYMGRGNDSTIETRTSTIDGQSWKQYGGVHAPMSGFWSLFGALDRLADLLEVLPSNAVVSFEVALDAGTNEYLVRAEGQMNYDSYKGLHSDHLYLVARYVQRGHIVRRRYLVDTNTQPHNTARFGVGR